MACRRDPTRAPHATVDFVLPILEGYMTTGPCNDWELSQSALAATQAPDDVASALFPSPPTA